MQNKNHQKSKWGKSQTDHFLQKKHGLIKKNMLAQPHQNTEKSESKS